MRPGDQGMWRDLRSVAGDVIGYRNRGIGFRDIDVYPTQDLNQAKHLNVYRGGPDWPFFHLQTVVRHCRGPVPIPADRRPHREGSAFALAETGLWCGPVSAHFGHMIADFGMRIAGSSLIDGTTPLVFSTRPGPQPAPLPAFWAILRHFGIPPGRVHLVSEPTRYARLRVLPQAERLAGGGPSRHHLARMEAFAGPSLPRTDPVVYVTRASRPDGRIAGESALNAALADCGVTVFDPESRSLAEQLALYRQAEHIVFAEGSAVHALQLLGRIDAKVTVLARRPRARLAAASLVPRVRALAYIHAVRGTVHGLRPCGAPQVTSGISVLDETRVIAGLGRAGIDLARHWDSGFFARSCKDDIAAWVARRCADVRHIGEPAYIDRRLRSLAIGI